RVTAGRMGGSPAPLSPGGEHPGPARCLPPTTAPYQHLPPEPAQMLQECGSATTRYCRNAPRVGKGQTGARPASTIPSTHILWEKDKTPIEPSGRFHVEDSGLYVCKAKNSVGATYAAATLKVEAGEPQEEEGCSGGEAPAFLVEPEDWHFLK
uniref:Ig-like domain-containing protein n=1 Tax=Buteo japonicus TaxID=224669 RepID=A0A8C0BWY7_9AVES